MLDGTEMAREREKINQPEHTAGHSQNKAIPEKSELVADQATTGWRQEVGGGERGKLGPRDSTPTKLQTGLQFLTKDFLRFWMVDIRWEGRG